MMSLSRFIAANLIVFCVTNMVITIRHKHTIHKQRSVNETSKMSQSINQCNKKVRDRFYSINNFYLDSYRHMSYHIVYCLFSRGIT